MTTRKRSGIDPDELASRGKKAEAAVQAYLSRLKIKQGTFDFERKYDARSARGRFQPQTGDFGLWRLGLGDVTMSASLEVKTVDHDYLLPAKNFPPAGIGRMRRRWLAGCFPIVLVFHTPSERWRCPPFPTFLNHDPVPSWNLSDMPTYPTASAALEDHFPAFFLF